MSSTGASSSSSTSPAGPRRILVVRLSSMGDIIHTLPAVATLKHSFGTSRLSWIIDARWQDLLERNPFVDEVIPLRRQSLPGIWEACGRLRRERFDLAVDFQGLMKSAAVALAARADRVAGYHQSQLREPVAGLAYSLKARVSAPHVVDRHLELVRACGANSVVTAFPLPAGQPEGALPSGPFVLACPWGGWPGKQWPLENYSEVGKRLEQALGLPLVVNGPPAAASVLLPLAHVRVHVSGLGGLIDATRRSVAVLGIDSGPAHLAAALNKPGVVIYGPTCPQRNGPYGGSLQVLRSPNARTTYKRRKSPDPSMLEITPVAVFEALREQLLGRARPASCTA